jgi:hypothetical protein
MYLIIVYDLYIYFKFLSLTLIKMGLLKNDLENFNCLFLKKV